MKNLFVTIFILIGFLARSRAQEYRSYRAFSTQKNHQRLIKERPNIRDVRKKNEQFVSNFRKAGQIKEAVIPVVFHVLFSSAEERITEAQLTAQLAALNRDFGNLTEKNNHPAGTLQGFDKRAANMDIQFCLAVPDEADKTLLPINYVTSSGESWRSDHQLKAAKEGGADPWDTRRYLNIWICKLADGVSGYSQLPGGPAQTDGIVLDYRYVGPTNLRASGPYSQGKTLTHLVGSYLNLFELWNESGRCVDDYVLDTPVHNGPNYECPAYKHFSTCRGNPVEMTMNFMDNTDDHCMYLFTEGQKWRMHSTLARGGLRSGLIEGTTRCARTAEFPQLATDSFMDEGTDQTSQPIELKVYPNPTESNEAFLEAVVEAAASSKISVFDPFGRLVHSFTWSLQPGRQTYRLDIRDWPSGLYFIQLDIDQQQFGLRLMLSND